MKLVDTLGWRKPNSETKRSVAEELRGYEANRAVISDYPAT